MSYPGLTCSPKYSSYPLKKLYYFSGEINEKSIIKSVEDIERILKQQGTSSLKIRNLFTLVIETLQNMLNYSYTTLQLNPHQREALCHFTLFHEPCKNHYILESCNIVNGTQKEIIESKLTQINALDKKALRQLIQEKIKLKVDKHHKGAGLGFILMARKSSKPITAYFLPVNKNRFCYIQRLIV